MAENVGQIKYEITVDDKGLITGIKNANKEIESTGKEAEKSDSKISMLGKSLIAIGSATVIAGITAVTRGIAGLGKSAISAFADYQQLEGGVKKIFGDDATQTVIDNARKAYEVAGLSVNEYLEQVTGFSAKLQRETGGNMAEVARLADMALRDMADNANTYGTNMTDIQNAYQGFAKGNATMLDNLKLGYGGTQTEMLQLAKDMGIVEASVKSFNDLSFTDAIEAIHKLQTELKIAGTTSTESATTVQGSINKAKKSWDNFILAIGTGENVKEATEALGTSLQDVFKTLSPVIQTIAETLPTALEELAPVLSDVMTKLFETLKPVIASLTESLVPFISELLSTFAPILAEGLVRLVIALIPALLKAVYNLVETLFTSVSDLVNKGLNALLDQYTKWFDTIAIFMEQLVDKIRQKIDHIKDFFVNLALSIANTFQNIGNNIVSIWNGIVEKIKGFALKIGDGISGAIRGAVNGVLGFATNVINGFIGAINGAISVINAIPGVSISSISTLSAPQLATGGIVEARQGGQIIRAGEAGEDEWVVPESKMESLIEQFNGRGGGVTINLYGTFATSESEQRRVAEQIYEALQDVNKSRMGAYL